MEAFFSLFFDHWPLTQITPTMGLQQITGVKEFICVWNVAKIHFNK